MKNFFWDPIFNPKGPSYLMGQTISANFRFNSPPIVKGILYILYLYLINLKVTNSGLIYGIDLKGVLLTNFPTPHNPLNVRPIDR